MAPRTLVASLGLVFVLALPAAAQGGRDLLVGVGDDTPKWIARPNGVIGVQRDIGLDAARITLSWKRAQTGPSRLQQIYLSRIAQVAALGQRVVLAVYGPAREAPSTDWERTAFCRYTARAVRKIPAIRDVVIWNEANNHVYWPAELGASGYTALLSRCYDVLHSLDQPVNVLDSTAPHQDPGKFIEEMGEAYRASGREAPLVDTFGHNVYPEHSLEPPSARHDNGSIDQGDYGRLMTTYAKAFGGTAQPLPGTGTTTIWYLEDGFQTRVPAEQRHRYHGKENARQLVSAGAAYESGVDQATQLRLAIELAYCQPAVGAFFNFQLIDEHRLDGWQSGILWSDGKRKPSYDAVKDVVAAVHADAIDCSQVVGAPGH